MKKSQNVISSLSIFCHVVGYYNDETNRYIQSFSTKRFSFNLFFLKKKLFLHLQHVIVVVVIIIIIIAVVIVLHLFFLIWHKMELEMRGGGTKLVRWYEGGGEIVAILGLSVWHILSINCLSKNAKLNKKAKSTNFNWREKKELCGCSLGFVIWQKNNIYCWCTSFLCNFIIYMSEKKVCFLFIKSMNFILLNRNRFSKTRSRAHNHTNSHLHIHGTIQQNINNYKFGQIGLVENSASFVEAEK